MISVNLVDISEHGSMEVLSFESQEFLFLSLTIFR